MLVPDEIVPLERDGSDDAGAGVGVFEAVLPVDRWAGRDGAGLARDELGLGDGAGARPATRGASAVEPAGGTTSTDATESRIIGVAPDAEPTAVAAAESE